MASQAERRVTTAEDPLIIPSPVLGMLNLLGDAENDLLLRDLAEVGQLFPDNVRVETTNVPRCNILFLYCRFEQSGRIAGTQLLVRDVIKAAGAQIAVIASEVNPGLFKIREFSQALAPRSDWPANLVITLNRNGDIFGRFFHKLFSQMQAGVTMPFAWATLAPQGPVSHKDVPGTICAMGAGHIAFAARRS